MPIAVTQMPNEVLANRLLELAEVNGWQLIGLAEYRNQLPADLSVDGALVTHPPESPLVQELLSRGLPTVRLGRMPRSEDTRVPAVVPDRLAMGRAAAEHFAERGYQHIAYIAHPTWRYFRSYYHGLKSRTGELGGAIHLYRMHGDRPDYARDSPEQWEYQQADFTRSLARLPKPAGLLASSDVTAGRYCRWILDAGLRVPEDVALLGIGNDRFLCESSPVPISSIAPNWPRMIETAAQMLIDRMAGRKLEQACVPVGPLGVVTRRSTDMLAVSDPGVARALGYMWDHLDQDLTVDQIAAAARVSRRTLERAFERELGRGIFAEYQRRRLEEARTMLLQTDLRIAQIARSLGFSSANYFAQAFRKAYGQSPAQSRRESQSR
jgi:LacI family transcriptional regulator